MAYFAMGTCFGCKQPFTFNPHLVPSIPIDGVREPVCRRCVDVANPRRIAGGLEPIVVQPGAYDVVGEETDRDA